MRTVILVSSLLFLLTRSYGQDVLAGSLVQDDTLQARESLQQALKTCQEIIKRNPSFYPAYLVKLSLLSQANEYKSGIKLCKTTLKKFPDSTGNNRVYANYGFCLMALHKPRRAMKIFNKGIKKYPDSYFIYFRKGVAEDQLGRKKEAITDLKVAVRLEPRYAPAHEALAQSLYPQYKIPAILCLVTDLLLDPAGEKARGKLDLLLKTLGGEKDSTESSGFSPAPDSLSLHETGEDDFYGEELVLSLRRGLAYREHYRQMPPAVWLAESLKVFLFFRLDKSAQKGFFRTFYIPFLRDIEARSILETACRIIYFSSGDIQNKQWLSDNQDKVRGFNVWLSNYGWDQL